jgi:hypothetical protein
MNRLANRLEALVHEGFDLWLCARRLHQGRFVAVEWERLEEYAAIRVL